MSRIIFALLMLCASSSAFAQADAMTELYGEGVHRYYNGNYFGADQALTTVVDSGSLDPRAYYFRGLAREMLSMDGEMDFQTGARLEAEGKRVVDVGFALSRVQGHMRTQIEQARRDARILASQMQLEQQQARRSDGDMVPAPDTTATPPAPSETETSDDPFATDGMRSDDATVAPAQPTLPEVDAAVNPFGDDPAPGAPAAGAEPDAANPFGSPTPAEVSDPFGGTAPTASDPFGAPADTTPAPAAADPFSAPAEGIDDPFNAPAADAPAADTPGSGADPFAPPPGGAADSGAADSGAADSGAADSGADPFSAPAAGAADPFGL